MPAIDNPKHEAFAHALATGATQSNAYVIAGYKKNRAAASRLATSATVVQRVKEITGQVAANAFGNSLEDVLAQIEEDRQFARQKNQPAVALNATSLKAKLLGYSIEKTETKTANFNYNTMTPEELKFEMTAILQEARKLGAKH